jgi:hypothetical protein
MLKQIQKSITQGAGVTSTELTLGTSSNTIITQCNIQSLGTGTVSLVAGPSSSTKTCFLVSINNSIAAPISSYLAPIHNLTNVVTIKSDGFAPATIINVIINYRELSEINTLQSSIYLENYSATSSSIGATPLLSNSESTTNYNIKSFFISTSSATNTITLKIFSTEFPTGVLLIPPLTGGFGYEAMQLSHQMLLPMGSSFTVDMTEASASAFFISYTKVPA